MVAGQLGKGPRTSTTTRPAVSFSFFFPLSSPNLVQRLSKTQSWCAGCGQKELQEKPSIIYLKQQNSGHLWERELGKILASFLFVLFFLSVRLQPPGNPTAAAGPVTAKQVPKILRERNSYLWSEKLWSQECSHCYSSLSSCCSVLEAQDRGMCAQKGEIKGRKTSGRQ